eukprot:scaffold288222_cov22-Prasinocladus_malaysianus.AAC.2
MRRDASVVTNDGAGDADIDDNHSNTNEKTAIVIVKMRAGITIPENRRLGSECITKTFKLYNAIIKVWTPLSKNRKKNINDAVIGHFSQKCDMCDNDTS